MTLDVVMIVRDEEAVLRQCLESITGLYNRLIILDTGSTDNTIKIAREFTKHVYQWEWQDDFALARNEAMKYSTADYILQWDADFTLDPDSKNRFKKLRQSLQFSSPNVFTFRWFTEYNEEGMPIKYQYRNLLFKRTDFIFRSPIHNYIKLLPGRVMNREFRLDIEVHHHKDLFSKDYRYTQTAEIIEKTLKDRGDLSDFEYYRLIYFHAFGLMFDQDYQTAIKMFALYLENQKMIMSPEDIAFCIEKVGLCSLKLNDLNQLITIAEEYEEIIVDQPRYILLMADIMAISNPALAHEYYRKYLDNPVDPDITRCDYDVIRYEDHPKHMLELLQ